MAERMTSPREPQSAEVWRSHHGCSVGLRDAAVINKMQLTEGDTDILQVGCGYGTLLVALYKCVRALTENEANIVGIDHCLPLLHEARACIQQLKDTSQGRGDDVSRTIRVHWVDVMNITRTENLQKLRSCFPQGPKVIVAVGVFDDLANPAAQSAIRDLVALQPHGGRFILGTHHQPVSCSSIILLKRISHQARVVGILNLIPESATTKLEDHARRLVQQIDGHTNICSPEEHARSRLPHLSGGPPIRQDQNLTTCSLHPQVIGSVLEDFTMNTMSEIVNIDNSVRLSHEATFVFGESTHGRTVNTSRPEIKFVDVSVEYTTAVAEHLTRVEQDLQVRSLGRATTHPQKLRRALLAHIREGTGLDNLNMLFHGYIHPDNPPAPDNYIPHLSAARDVIRNAADEIIRQPFGTDWDWFQVVPASVLTSFSKW